MEELGLQKMWMDGHGQTGTNPGTEQDNAASLVYNTIKAVQSNRY